MQPSENNNIGINPLVSNGLFHIWVSPLPFLGESGVVLNFYYSPFLMIFFLSKQNSPRLDTVFCGITSGAILLAYVSQKGHQV